MAAGFATPAGAQALLEKYSSTNAEQSLFKTSRRAAWPWGLPLPKTGCQPCGTPYLQSASKVKAVFWILCFDWGT